MSSSLTGVTKYRCGGMVDTLVLGTSAEMCEGSSPFIGTNVGVVQLVRILL